MSELRGDYQDLKLLLDRSALSRLYIRPIDCAFTYSVRSHSIVHHSALVGLPKPTKLSHDTHDMNTQ